MSIPLSTATRRTILAVITPLALAAALTPSTAEAAAAPDDWKVVSPKAETAGFDDIAVTSGAVWAVGDDSATGKAVAWRRTHSTWAATPVPVTDDGALHAVDARGAAVWAVGRRTRTDGTFAQLVIRWNGSEWVRVTAPTQAAGALSDIDIASDGTVWASGWADVHGAEHAVAYRYADGAWKRYDRGIEHAYNGNALAVVSENDVWLALNPGMAHFDGATWTLAKEFPQDGSVIITSLSAETASPDTDVWSAGVAYPGNGEVSPSVWHFGDGAWTPVRTPNLRAQLYDIALTSRGPVAVGEQFDASWASSPVVLALKGKKMAEYAAPKVTGGILTGADLRANGQLWVSGIDTAGPHRALAAFTAGW